MSMISSLTWVRRGVPAENPEKIELSEEQIQALIGKAKEANPGINFDEENMEDIQEKAAELNDDSDDSDDDEMDMDNDKNNGEFNDLAEFNMDDYDNEESNFDVGGLTGLVYHSSNKQDPFITMEKNDDDEIEDFRIKPTDNLILVGQTEEEMSRLEVYIYEEDQNNLYVHHDILVAGVPLCLESIEYDPGNPEQKGNLVAVGTMLPQIEIWDVDIVDGVEPLMTLGQLPPNPDQQSNYTPSKKKNAKGKKNKKMAHKQNRIDPSKTHTDAVLGLAWNKPNKNILASCSADKSVKIWDLNSASCIYSFSHHLDKIQTVAWNPVEPTMLLTGSYDKTCCLVDSRNPEEVLRWNVSSDIESCIWNPFHPEQFIASCDDGMVYCCDARKPQEVLYSINAHTSAVCGLSFSTYIPGCLVTTGADKVVKVWDIESNEPTCIVSQQLALGPIYAVGFCPDTPFIVAAGGGKGKLNVWSIGESANVVNQFSERAQAYYNR